MSNWIGQTRELSRKYVRAAARLDKIRELAEQAYVTEWAANEKVEKLAGALDFIRKEAGIECWPPTELVCLLHGPFGDKTSDKYCPGCVVVAEGEPNSPASQVERLAHFIANEISGQQQPINSAVDAAISVMNNSEKRVVAIYEQRDVANDALREIREIALRVIPAIGLEDGK